MHIFCQIGLVFTLSSFQNQNLYGFQYCLQFADPPSCIKFVLLHGLPFLPQCLVNPEMKGEKIQDGGSAGVHNEKPHEITILD